MKKDKINRYYNTISAIEVLGSILNKPFIMEKSEYILREEDFVSPLHRVVFKCAYNLGVVQGFREIKIGDIESYLSQRDPVSHKKIFENEENLKWLTDIKAHDNSDFDYYYNKLKKFSLIRAYLKNGIECVTKIFNPDETEIKLREQQENRLDNMTIDDIKKYVNDSLIEVNTIFTSYDEALTHRKSGDNIEELFRRLKEDPPYGFNTESEYLNTAIMGFLPKKLIIETRSSNLGKSRNAIKRLIGVCAKRLWSFKENKYIDNPNYLPSNSALYIGTEMDLFMELEPIIIAFISGVEQSHIMKQEYEEGEKDRVYEAIEISKEMKLYMEDQPNFDAQWMWKTVEYYKKEYDICMVCLDYLEITASLTNEFIKNGGTKGKDDICLINFTNELKQIVNKFNITMVFYTQSINSSLIEKLDWYDNNTIKGCSNLHVKCDAGLTVFPPTAKMLDQMEEVIQVANRRLRKEGHKGNYKPNAVYTLYKNRMTGYRNIRIWCYLDQGNGRIQELFVTDKENNIVDIDKTIIKVRDSKNEKES